MTSPSNHTLPPRRWRLLSLLTTLSLLFLGLITSAPTAQADPEAGSGVRIDDIRFEEETFTDGESQRLHVDWSIPDRAVNPVTLTVSMPENLRIQGAPDSFELTGPDGNKAGACELTASEVTCEVDPDFIEENPYEVSGSFFIRVETTFRATEEFTHEFVFGSIAVPVTIKPDARWCKSFVEGNEVCRHGGQSLYKSGSYDSHSDTIEWTVAVPADKNGLPAGKKVTVTDLLDESQYELLLEGAYPRVQQGNTLAVSDWGHEYIQWRTVSNDKVQWSSDYKTVTFTSEAGPGADSDQGEGIRAIDGSFYRVQWKVKVDSPGEVDSEGNRRFVNKAEYSIGDDKARVIDGSATRWMLGGNVVGTNYGKFQITKELDGDTTLNPEFTIKYTVTEPGKDAVEKTASVQAGQTFTSMEYYKGTKVTLKEVTPTTPGNVNWSEPVFVDSAGNKVTSLTFSADNKNLGKITSLTLKNNAKLKKASFTAKKSIINDDGVPAVSDKEFKLKYNYSADPEKGIPAGSGSLTIPGDGSVVASGELPIGAKVRFEEAPPASIPGATWGTPVISPETITIGAAENPVIEVTNTLTQDLGRFAITKDISGEGADLVEEGAKFTVTYTYSSVNGFPGGSGEIEVTAGAEPAHVTGIPAGAEVNLEEIAPQDPLGGKWAEPQFDLASFTVTKDQVVNINLDNPISWNDGAFSARKVVDGDGADLVGDSEAFVIDYQYQLPAPIAGDDATGEGSLTVLNDGELVQSDPLPYGTEVTVAERQPAEVPGGTWVGQAFDHESFTIGDETVFDISLTNTIERDLGSMSLTKSVVGGGSHLVSDDAEFVIDYSYPEGPGFDGGDGKLTIPASGEEVTVKDLPAGAVITLSERDPADPKGGTWANTVFVDGKTIVIEKDHAITATVENTIDLLSGDFSVTKKVTGSGKDLIKDDASFVIDYRYADGPGFEGDQGELEVFADGSATVSGPIPYGAEVELNERRPAHIVGGLWEDAKFSQDSLTIDPETTVEVSLTNTITKDAAPVSKRSGDAPSTLKKPIDGPSPVSKTAGTLPITGSSVAIPVMVGLLLTLIGGLIVFFATRKGRL